jgi:hypothetical protein
VRTKTGINAQAQLQAAAEARAREGPVALGRVLPQLSAVGFDFPLPRRT